MKMTRAEAEGIFLSTVLSGEDTAVELDYKETSVLRVLVGRLLKDMEKSNKKLWLTAREYGIEYRPPYAVIRKFEQNRYKMFRLGKDGVVTPVDYEKERDADHVQEEAKIDITEEVKK